MNEVVAEVQRNKGRRDLIILMAVFVSPIVLALVLYNNLDKWQAGATKNYGELVTPARPLKDIPLQKLDGKAYKFSDQRRKWLIVYIGSAECDRDCAINLYKMRQSRLAQGGELGRVKRLYIMDGHQASDSLRAILNEHPGLDVVSGNAVEINNIKQQFAIKQNGRVGQPAMYLVDPLGNLMMSYPQGFAAKGMAKDLAHLLKASQIG